MIIGGLIIGCKTNEPRESSSGSRVDEELEQEVSVVINYGPDIEYTELQDNGLYKIGYSVNLSINEADYLKSIEYKISDETGNELFDDISIIDKYIQDNQYIDKIVFYDYFLHRRINYSIIVNTKTEQYKYNGSLYNDDLPEVSDEVTVSVVNRFIEGIKATSLNITSEVLSPVNLSRVNLIPPSQNSQWDLPFEIIKDGEEEKAVVSASVINDNYTTYIENGTYILQFQFNEYGIVQKEIDIFDLFDNKNGPNYGLSIPNVKEISNKSIEIDFGLEEKIEKMEIWLFIEQNGKMNQLGIATYYSSFSNISKKDLFNNCYDKSEKVKLSYNKKYFFKVYIYAENSDDISYISVSDLNEIKFSGFSFFF